MKINEIVESVRTPSAKELTLIICYDTVYIKSLELLQKIRRIRKDQVALSVGTATYLSDMCRDIINNIDNLPVLTVPFPKHIRSGIVDAYNYLIMNNANPE